MLRIIHMYDDIQSCCAFCGDPLRKGWHGYMVDGRVVRIRLVTRPLIHQRRKMAWLKSVIGPVKLSCFRYIVLGLRRQCGLFEQKSQLHSTFTLPKPTWSSSRAPLMIFPGAFILSHAQPNTVSPLSCTTGITISVSLNNVWRKAALKR